MAARKREWTIFKVIAAHTEGNSPVVKVSVMGLLDVRGCQEREVQKQKHTGTLFLGLDRLSRGAFWSVARGLGEWGDCTFCTFLGNGMGIVMACCPGNHPGPWLS